MGHEECGEVTVDMWCLIQAKLIARKQENIDPSIKAQILSESMKLYMTKIIQKGRSEGQTQLHKDTDNPPSEKQIALIAKMGGDPRDISSRQEASEWINKHKDW